MRKIPDGVIMEHFLDFNDSKERHWFHLAFPDLPLTLCHKTKKHLEMHHRVEHFLLYRRELILSFRATKCTYEDGCFVPKNWDCREINDVLFMDQLSLSAGDPFKYNLLNDVKVEFQQLPASLSPLYVDILPHGDNTLYNYEYMGRMSNFCVYEDYPSNWFSFAVANLFSQGDSITNDDLSMLRSFVEDLDVLWRDLSLLAIREVDESEEDQEYIQLVIDDTAMSQAAYAEERRVAIENMMHRLDSINDI